MFLQSCFLYLKFYSSHIYLLKSNTSYQPSNSLGLLVNRPTNQTVIKAALYYLVLLPHQDHTDILNTLPLIPTRPFRYDLNQIPYDYTVEVRNRFKGLDLIECLMNYGLRFVTLYWTQGSRPSPGKRKA